MFVDGLETFSIQHLLHFSSSGLCTFVFELLDALTRSGGLSIDHASLHVIVAARHSFDKTITDTIVQVEHAHAVGVQARPGIDV